MLVSEVIELASTQTEEYYNEITWIQFINMALDDLTTVAKLLDNKPDISVVLTNGRGTVNLLTAIPNAHEILDLYFKGALDTTAAQLRRLDINNYLDKGWKLFATSIQLQGLSGASGVVSVDYYKKLTHIANVADDLSATGLPEQYHNLVVLYISAKSQQKEEELEDKRDYFAEYEKGKRSMFVNRTYQMEPHNRKQLEKLKLMVDAGLEK